MKNEELPSLGVTDGSVTEDHPPGENIEGTKKKAPKAGKQKPLLFMTMMREPYERLVSGFHYRHHNCPRCNRSTNFTEYASAHLSDPEGWGPAGCATKMLMGRYFVIISR